MEKHQRGKEKPLMMPANKQFYSRWRTKTEEVSGLSDTVERERQAQQGETADVSSSTGLGGSWEPFIRPRGWHGCMETAAPNAFCHQSEVKTRRFHLCSGCLFSPPSLPP